MLNPYFLMTALYVALATLMALDASLINFEFLNAIAGLRWLRVHFITLGALTEFSFGFLPLLVAARHHLPRPKVRWDIWALLNLGVLILIVAVPQINAVLMTTGGTLVFIAAILLVAQLWQLGGSSAFGLSSGRWFYITGIVYLLFGIIIGTGLWQPWLRWFQMKVPIEVHIHANNWGFMSLVFAGLLIDMYPKFSGRELAWSKSIKPIFWMMNIGALLLVLAPWTGMSIPLAPIGIVLHLGATLWLLAGVIKPLEPSQLWKPGILHLVVSYVWIILPVLFAPLVILDAGGLASQGIEQNAPQALIYGWVLQFGFAIVPFVFRRISQPDGEARLGGNWFSFVFINLGSLVFWSSIFMPDMLMTLQGVTYALWTLAMLPIAWELWEILRDSLQSDTEQEVVAV